MNDKVLVRAEDADQILQAALASVLVSKRVAEENSSNWREIARPVQIEPSGNWLKWLFLGGRGAGKTRTGAEWCHEQVRAGCRRGAAVGATAGDVRDILVEGPAGLLATCPPDLAPIIYEPSKLKVTYANGAVIKLYSGEEPARLRGPEHDFAWADELCFWKRAKKTWDNLMFGLRIPPNPRVFISTTPLPIKILKEIIAEDGTVTVTSSTYDNIDNLAPIFIDKVIKPYEGTRLGRQELMAEILEDIPGALWTADMIEATRLPDMTNVPIMRTMAVGIDPAVSDTENTDETGIMIGGVAPCDCDGKGEDHAFIFEDRSAQMGVYAWAKSAVRGYAEWQADHVVAEVNNGGDLVEVNLRVVDPLIPVKKVHASRGKYKRAEPVSTLYEKLKVHHVGRFPKLEDELCAMVPNPPKGADSPNRADALVWLLTDLMTLPSRKWTMS